MGQIFAVPIATFATIIAIIAGIIIIAVAHERKSSALRWSFYLTVLGVILLVVGSLMAMFTAGGKTISATAKNL